jgi:hypothetical protein
LLQEAAYNGHSLLQEAAYNGHSFPILSYLVSLFLYFVIKIELGIILPHPIPFYLTARRLVKDITAVRLIIGFKLSC